MKLITIPVVFLGLLCMSESFAQTAPYPNRPIAIVLPVSPGTSGDTSFRLLGEKMAAKLGQPLVMENAPGAAGLIGIDRFRKAPADGYTLLGGNDSSLLYLPLLNKNATFDPLKDFEPVTQIAVAELFLAVNSSFPAQSLADLVKLAKEAPGKIDFASAGPASPQHIAMELIMRRAGLQMNHVPYKGGTPAATDVAAGVVPVGVMSLLVAMPYLKSGRIRLIGSTSVRRSSLVPNVPTISETFTGFQFGIWVGFLAPRGTPREQINALREASVLALSDPGVVSTYQTLGLTPSGNTPEEFRRIIISDFQRLSELFKDAKIKIE